MSSPLSIVFVLFFLGPLAVGASKVGHAAVCSSLLLGSVAAHLLPLSPHLPEAEELGDAYFSRSSSEERSRYSTHVQSWYGTSHPEATGRMMRYAFAPGWIAGDASRLREVGVHPRQALSLSVQNNLAPLFSYAWAVSFLIFLRRALVETPEKDFLKLAEPHLTPPRSVLYLSVFERGSDLKGFVEHHFRERYGNGSASSATLIDVELGDDFCEFRDRLEGVLQVPQFDRIELLIDPALEKRELSAFRHLMRYVDLNFAQPGAELVIWADNAAVKTRGEEDSLAERWGRWLLKRGGTVIACPRKLRLFDRMYGASTETFDRIKFSVLNAWLYGVGLGVLVELFVRFLPPLTSQNLFKALSEITILDIESRGGGGGGDGGRGRGRPRGGPAGFWTELRTPTREPGYVPNDPVPMLAPFRATRP